MFYPATRLTYDDNSTHLVVFRTATLRQAHLLSLIQEKRPQILTLTRKIIDTHLAENNIKLKYEKIECDKNLGRKSWPIGYHCKKCDSVNIIQDTVSIWNIEDQIWEHKDVKDKAYCLECNSETVSIEKLLAVEILPQTA